MMRTVTDIREGLASGRFSSEEITRDYLARIDAHSDLGQVFFGRDIAVIAIDCRAGGHGQNQRTGNRNACPTAQIRCQDVRQHH